MRRLHLDVADGDYTVSRLPAGTPPPPELFTSPSLVSVTSTSDHVSVVCRSEIAPPSEQAERGWRLLTVRGPLEFDLTGIMAALAGTLAAAGVSLFAVSTYETDHVLVKADDLARAVDALSQAGHEVGSA